MATNDRNAPGDSGRTNARKDSEDSDSDHDSLGFYAEKAPPDTSIETIIAAYQSDTVASKIDWDSFGGDVDA